MSSKRVRKHSKLVSYTNWPIRVLAQSWDAYVKSMSGLAGPVTYGNAMGCPVPHIPTVHSNHRTADEELRDPIRLATARRLTGKFVAQGFHRPNSVVPIGGGAAASAPRGIGNTTAFGRIDEDEEEF